MVLCWFRRPTGAPLIEGTIPEYVKRFTGENTLESPEEALASCSNNALTFARLAQRLIATDQTVRAEAQADADWFRRYATNLAPA
jgi:hypothetical protein